MVIRIWNWFEISDGPTELYQNRIWNQLTEPFYISIKTQTFKFLIILEKDSRVSKKSENMFLWFLNQKKENRFSHKLVSFLGLVCFRFQ